MTTPIDWSTVEITVRHIDPPLPLCATCRTVHAPYLSCEGAALQRGRWEPLLRAVSEQFATPGVRP
ncbi:hypothetical protein [Streptomyces aculeolatus]|uniref:hypothetical protein n=1 Tax=Streptomyces aculeolatus TaxID=270689 RepID=UPI001CEDEEEA|nr:hypothetical protein [Streptomyces aculeolatus]